MTTLSETGEGEVVQNITSTCEQRTPEFQHQSGSDLQPARRSLTTAALIPTSTRPWRLRLATVNLRKIPIFFYFFYLDRVYVNKNKKNRFREFQTLTSGGLSFQPALVSDGMALPTSAGTWVFAARRPRPSSTGLPGSSAPGFGIYHRRDACAPRAFSEAAPSTARMRSKASIRALGRRRKGGG